MKGFAAAGLLLAILVGVPVVLVALAQVPGFLPSWYRVQTLLSSPDDGRVFLVLIWATAWVLWLYLSWLILTECIAAIRSIAAPDAGSRESIGVSSPRGMVRSLVATALLLFVALPTISPPAHAETTPPPEPGPAAGVVQSLPQVGGDEELLETPESGDSDRVEQDAADFISVVVQRGDTLWELAATYMGDPLRWPEIFEANQGVEQPGGYTLSDPDLIDVGWVLQIPQDVPSRTPADDAAPEPAAGERQREGGGAEEDDTAGVGDQRDDQVATPAEAPGVPDADSGDIGDDDVAGDESDPESDAEQGRESGWLVSGLVGAGVFLGAGVFWLLNRRRREQFRVRKPGRVIAEPDVAIAPIEQTARTANGLSSARLSRLDAVMRRLAAPGHVPDLTFVGVALDGTITVHSKSPLDEPWKETSQGWILPASVSGDQLGQVPPDRPAPYPLLVTMGADDEGVIWLLNLEAMGYVGLGGDEVMAADFARYVAAELAVNPWAEARIACRGVSEAVVPMAPERLDADLAEVTQIAQMNLDRSLRESLPASQGRLRQAGDEAWGAVAVLSNSDQYADELRDLITRHPQRTGAAVVALDPEGELQVTSSGRLHGLGMDLTAVGLTEDEAAGCAALLSTASLDDSREPFPRDDLVDELGNVLPEHRVPRNDYEHPSTEPLLPRPIAEYLEAAVVVERDLDVLAPKVAAPVALELIERDPLLDEYVRLWFSDACHLPRLAMLGPVEARCHGQALAKQRAYYTEVLAFLALHPGGVTTDQVATAFGISPERVRIVMSKLRSWLGTNPTTKQLHIPDAKSSAQAKARGVGLYVVEDLLVDVDLVRRLRARGMARGADGIEDLETVLQMVRGRPFDQLRPAGWAWLLDGDRVDHQMVCAIGDVAHTVVTHHLHAGDLDAAHEAAAIGLQADPDSEMARMDLAGIIVQQGHSQAARDIVAQALGESADLDATERTNEILARKKWLDAG